MAVPPILYLLLKFLSVQEKELFFSRSLRRLSNIFVIELCSTLTECDLSVTPVPEKNMCTGSTLGPLHLIIVSPRMNHIKDFPLL